MSEVFVDWSMAPEGTTHAYVGNVARWENGSPTDHRHWEKHTDEVVYEYSENGWIEWGRPGKCFIDYRIARPAEPEQLKMSEVFVDWSKAPDGTTHAYVGNEWQWDNGVPFADRLWEKHDDETIYEYTSGGWVEWDFIHNVGGSEYHIARPAEPEVEHIEITELPAEEALAYKPEVFSREHNIFEGGEADQFVLQCEGYSSLASVLKRAFDQASAGKGKERHANDLPFDEQPMQSISDLLDSTAGMEFQVFKKVKEAKSLPTFEQQERELLGAINYIAGILIFLEKRRG